MASPAERLTPAARQALQQAMQAGHVLQDLPNRLHPAWTAAIGVDPGLLSQGGSALLNTALLFRFDLRWPDLSAAGCGFENAWLLAPEELRRLCAARAVFAWRETLARSVDAGLRRRARAAIGDQAFTVLLHEPAVRRPTPERPPLVEPDTMVRCGWALLRQAQSWGDARARRLIELMLPPDASVVEGIGGVANAADHARFLLLLPRLFPEHAWLFGSEPVRSTLA